MHPRVRYAACNAIGQMSTDFPSVFQKKFHEYVIPTLLMLMDDVQNPRVQAHAGERENSTLGKYTFSWSIKNVILCNFAVQESWRLILKLDLCSCFLMVNFYYRGLCQLVTVYAQVCLICLHLKISLLNLVSGKAPIDL